MATKKTVEVYIVYDNTLHTASGFTPADIEPGIMMVTTCLEEALKEYRFYRDLRSDEDTFDLYESETSERRYYTYNDIDDICTGGILPWEVEING